MLALRRAARWLKVTIPTVSNMSSCFHEALFVRTKAIDLVLLFLGGAPIAGSIGAAEPASRTAGSREQIEAWME